MKVLFVIFVFIAIIPLPRVAVAQQVSFLFNSTVKNDNEDQRVLSKGFNEAFLVDAVQEIQKEFPCAVCRYLPDLRLCINEIRLWGTPAFGSQDVGPKIEKLINYFENSDYWVNYSLYPISNTMAVAEVKCADRKGKTLVEFTANLGIDQIMSNNIFLQVISLI